MSKVQLEVEIPDTIRGTQLEEKFVTAAQQVVQERTVIRLFEQGDISSGYAADLLGMNKHDFIQLLAKQGVPFFNYSPEEWEQELKNVERVKARLDAEGSSQVL